MRITPVAGQKVESQGQVCAGRAQCRRRLPLHTKFRAQILASLAQFLDIVATVEVRSPEVLDHCY